MSFFSTTHVEESIKGNTFLFIFMFAAHVDRVKEVETFI